MGNSSSQIYCGAARNNRLASGEQARADEVVVGAYLFKITLQVWEQLNQRRMTGIDALVYFPEGIFVKFD
ncbi:hypothetical protein D3C85_1841230 [compost metagenome]